MKSPIEVFKDKDLTLAIIVRSQFSTDRLEFLTPEDALLQVGFMKHSSGYVVKSHSHNPVERVTYGTQEILFMTKGRAVVSIFSGIREKIAESEISDGDVVILLAGGHGIEMLSDSYMFEVKNGPYAGKMDKTHF